MILPWRQLMGQVAATLAGAFWMIATALLGPALAEGLELWGAGSTFSAPLDEKWIAAFERVHPSIAVRHEAVGSGEGVARFSAGAVDFGASEAAARSPVPETSRRASCDPSSRAAN